MTGQRVTRKGQKKSVYFSGEQLAEMERQGLDPADVVRRGLAAVAVTIGNGQSPDLQPALTLVARVAEALAQGGKVVYEDRTGDAPDETG